MSVRVCIVPACPDPVVAKGRCRTHARSNERTVDRAGYRVYRSKRWQTTRRRYLFENPLCAECGAVATDVHHRKDLRDGGDPYAAENLQGLCKSHHSQKTRSEQLVRKVA